MESHDHPIVDPVWHLTERVSSDLGEEVVERYDQTNVYHLWHLTGIAVIKVRKL